MKKRVLVLALALMLVVSTTIFAAGAQESAKPGEKTKITFWSPFSGGDGDIMKSIVADFNAQSETSEVEFLIFKSEEYYTKLMVSVSSNSAPDVAILHLSRLLEFTSDDLLEPLNKHASAVGLNWNDFSGVLQKAAQIDGNYYAVPLDTHLLLMHFNTKWLGEMGMLDANGKPALARGEKAFFDYFNAVKGKLGENQMPLSGTSQFGLPQYVWYTLLTQYGGEIQNADGTKATLDTAENKKALSVMKQMVESGIWPKGQKNGAEIFTGFRATATINGNWGIPIFEKVNGLEFISMPFPQFTDVNSVYADSHTMVMPTSNQSDAKKQAAMEFMSWMADNTLDWAQAGHIPSKTKIVDSAAFKALPYRSEYAKSAEYAHFYPKSLALTGMIEVVQRELATMIAGDQDVNTTAANMQAGYQKLLDQKR